MFTYPFCILLVELTSITAVRGWTRGFFQQIQNKGNAKKYLDYPLTEGMCFTVAFSQQEYNLVGPDEETTNLWIETLNQIIPMIRIVQQENLYQMLGFILFQITLLIL